MKVQSRFDHVSEIKELFPRNFGVVGIGVTAFQRTGLSFVLPNFSVLCLLETTDLGSIRKKMEVVSVEKDLKGDLPEKYNTSSILGVSEVRKWLEDQKAKGVFVYKSTSKIEDLVAGLGMKIMSTPGKIRARFENKKEFRIDGEKVGLNIIGGETLLVDDLNENRWDGYRKKLGEKLVFQLPDYTIGGGIGTFFINSRSDFASFKDFVEKRREVREIEIVNVTKFIKGEPSSITGCATKHGVVTSILQKQIMDQPELAGLHGRSGVWLGHDWNVRYSEKAQRDAESLCKKWGEYMYKRGYKGIYGVDVVVDENDEVWPVECNSRYTGAFPVYTMTQVDRGEMPMNVWHMLEWMGIDYEMNIKEVQNEARKLKNGAHFILHNLERKWVTPTKKVKAGVYRMREDEVEWVRDGFSLTDIKNENELVLCDRVPTESMVLKPAERLGKLIFKRRVIGKDGRLLPEVRGVIKKIYNRFELAGIENPEED